LTIVAAGFHPRQRFGVWFRCPFAGTVFDGIQIPLTTDGAGVEAQFRLFFKLLNLLRAQTTGALLWFHVQLGNDCQPPRWMRVGVTKTVNLIVIGNNKQKGWRVSTDKWTQNPSAAGPLRADSNQVDAIPEVRIVCPKQENKRRTSPTTCTRLGAKRQRLANVLCPLFKSRHRSCDSVRVLLLFGLKEL
jgi:hypothetical protein